MANFLKVLEALTKLGFVIALVLCDGHKTNMKFFMELGDGMQELSIQNPFCSTSSRIFLMFDPVHIFKNFYHNFERKR